MSAKDTREGEREAMVAFLSDLVRIRSVCGVDGERPVAERIISEATALGLPSRLVAKDGDRPNVVVSVGSTDSQDPILFCFVAHVDTVDVGEVAAWRHGAPFDAVIEDGRMYGRGTCDCKAGVAVSLYALRRLKDLLPTGLKGRISLLCVVDEESGACSPLGLKFLLQSGVVPMSIHGSIYAYPGRSVTLGHRGVLRLEIKVMGHPVHSGIADWSMRRRGVNAVSALCRVVTALEDEPWPRDTSPAFPDLPFTLTPTIIKGGNYESIVPESATALIDVRLPPHLDVGAIQKRIEDIVHTAVLASGRGGGGGCHDDDPQSKCRATVEVKVSIPAYQISEHHPLVQACAQMVEQVVTKVCSGSVPVVIKGCGPANEGYMLGQAGIACICGLGPVGGNAHGIDEWVEVGESLSQTVDIYTGVVMKLVGTGP